jgi:class 3 adenylate cyclase
MNVKGTNMVYLQNGSIPAEKGPKKEVVILLSDMVQYSQKTSCMGPEEIRDFMITYHENIQEIIYGDKDDSLEVEPLAGDGALVIFEKQAHEGRAEICSRAVSAAVRMAHAIEEKRIPATRMGIYLGDIIEAKLGKRMLKFGSSFAVASRLEELCSYFGTTILMDREVARYQNDETRYLISIGKVTLQGLLHPMHVFSVYKPGIHNCPVDVNEALLLEFIRMKNTAMELFCGNSPMGITPDFPTVRNKLVKAQQLFYEMTGKEDLAIERILEYIRETPAPESDFQKSGMKLAGRKRDSLGIRLFRLSQQLLKAMDREFYHALVVDTDWERFFVLEWRKQGETVVKINEAPDGIYYIDRGEVDTFDESGRLIATLNDGNVFGEMAYFSKQKKRNATVVAKTDLVLRRITSEDFQRLPTIVKIFERIAQGRQEEAAALGQF